MVISFYLLKGDVVRERERIYITILFETIITLPSENCPQKILENVVKNEYQLDNLLHFKS